MNEPAMTTAQAAYRIGEMLNKTFYSNNIAPPEDAVILIAHQVIGEYSDSIVAVLQRMQKEWEAKITDDTSLYSLGLRRAIDIVNGEEGITYTEAGHETI